MKKLGIIGGLGPMASVYFWELIEKRTHVSTDQEHISITIMSIPDTPDRTAYILDHRRESPLNNLVEAGLKLKSVGVDCIAIPCVTAHYFHGELCQQIGLPIINFPQKLGEYLVEHKISKVGILATSGTVKSGFLQKELEKYQIESIVPDEVGQQKVMSVIYKEIKAGNYKSPEEFLAVGDMLKRQGAQALILGCTELSLLKKEFGDKIPADYIDVLEILADAAIEECLAPQKKEEAREKNAV